MSFGPSVISFTKKDKTVRRYFATRDASIIHACMSLKEHLDCTSGSTVNSNIHATVRRPNNKPDGVTTFFVPSLCEWRSCLTKNIIDKTLIDVLSVSGCLFKLPSFRVPSTSYVDGVYHKVFGKWYHTHSAGKITNSTLVSLSGPCSYDYLAEEAIFKYNNQWYHLEYTVDTMLQGNGLSEINNESEISQIILEADDA